MRAHEVSSVGDTVVGGGLVVGAEVVEVVLLVCVSTDVRRARSGAPLHELNITPATTNTATVA